MDNTLDQAIIAAHACDDRSALVDLYAAAADASGQIDTMCFFLTQAYIFALETDHAKTDELGSRLAGHGRI